MKRSLISLIILFLLSSLIFAQNNLTGPYIGQKTPGTTAEIFAKGIVSNDEHEFSCCFSPDGKEFYFSRYDPSLRFAVIMCTREINGIWTKPEVVPFVEKQYSFEPCVTPDNKRLYFQSGKSMPGQRGPGMNVLYVDRKGDGWSEAKDPGAPFNPMKAMHISMAKNGTIYTTDISGGPGSESLGIMKLVNGEYKTLEKMGDPFNRDKYNQHPWISPNEDMLIFTIRYPGQKIVSTLNCSFKNKDGRWSEPLEISLGIDAGQPFVTADGKFLFFTSGPQGKGDIYWVSAKIIEELRPKE